MPGPIAFEFGEFRFEPSSRQLRRGDRRIALAGRAADTLVVLLEHADTVVPKDTLLAAVWPDIAVEENNLNQQIAALRRALAQDDDAELIQTVPRRGYRLVGPVRRVDLADAPSIASGVRGAAAVDDAPSRQTRTARPRWVAALAATVVVAS